MHMIVEIYAYPVFVQDSSMPLEPRPKMLTCFEVLLFVVYIDVLLFS